ncbi:hypothetical protein F0562_020810 [Nyssa sinensis]|uniref:inositol-1,3,4-trisphosphate 5/6-kinase n=1 Tax=Nyssa sinensis TaxID=561372 RepID=A0A5J5BS15_9ASTE|nr:hypothetical protein F0562_020810 [Nyssa sinensis]
MRLHGEISFTDDEEEREKEVNFADCFGVGFPHPQKLVVGYARCWTCNSIVILLPHIGDLIKLGSAIRFCRHDQAFDTLFSLHFGLTMLFVATNAKKKHPEVTVLDPPNAIEHVRNRQSMLKDVADLKLADCYGKVGVPRQLFITKDPSSISDEVATAGLKLPLVAKPLVVDGSAKSHELFLAYDEFCLSKLDPTLVLQEFVNHVAGVYCFPRVSCAAASADDANLDPDVAELPPRPLLERLVKELRCLLGLRLFNIDMIRENGTRNLYYVIDINYFPGKWFLFSFSLHLLVL